jgi:hypothetical protein
MNAGFDERYRWAKSVLIPNRVSEFSKAGGVGAAKAVV